jgi:bifunctional enzyme CysN/CysC
LEDPVDASRGDVLAAAVAPPAVADQFEAKLLWMNERPLVPERWYVCKTHSKEIRAQVTRIEYRIDVNTQARVRTRTLALNQIGVVTVCTSQPLAFEPYVANRTLGGFILIDPCTFETVAAGMIDGAALRDSNVQWQPLEITRGRRAELKQQQPYCVWLTGLSGSGKSSIADRLEQRLVAEGRHTYVLDGDNVRHGLNRDLGFTQADRDENVRRIAEVAALLVDAGLIVLVSVISPFKEQRQRARSLFRPGEFIEVFVDTPLDECERRDPKGLYAKARAGTIPDFTGIQSAYDRPESPDVHVSTLGRSVADCVEDLLEELP